ncbi:hypothetical protein [Roseococcus pinisoli]|uniref:DUF5666 domain-containing protein n=1 Tax=Roseococcus pinisoli TaxID=2835040 RepID=A0ABS5QJH5_9PROT|nr:hypothetical protein [Roseococcus pinisoli]MBS7813804.1 hypothetical protein [Roseococcus pinisoli]
MNRRLFLTLPLTLALPAISACQSSIDTEESITLNGVIETVDPTSREVLIRGQSGAQSGRLVSMVVGSRVQRLNQIRPGDRVTVHYYQALAARVARPRAGSAEPPFAGERISREAARPGGEMTRVHAARVTITAIDRETSAVTFTGPGNLSRTVTPRNPEVLEFVRTLRVGDQVDMVYEEALAVSIEPMR